MILTTTENIEGYNISNYLGLVYAQKYSGLKISESIEILEKSLIDSATEKGANAIIGIKYSNYGHDRDMKLFVYGTAVKIEKCS